MAIIHGHTTHFIRVTLARNLFDAIFRIKMEWLIERSRNIMSCLYLKIIDMRLVAICSTQDNISKCTLAIVIPSNF